MSAFQTYNKKQKLKSRKQIGELFDKGRSIHISPVRVLYQVADKQPDELYFTKAAVSVSSRHFKTAVQRNRIKRLLRECWRLEKTDLEKALSTMQKEASVFIIYSGSMMPAFAELRNLTKNILQRIIKNI